MFWSCLFSARCQAAQSRELERLKELRQENLMARDRPYQHYGAYLTIQHMNEKHSARWHGRIGQITLKGI